MYGKFKQQNLVIIGGDAAGMSAASRAKRINPNLNVIAFERTNYISYGACGIPYYVAGLVKDYRDLIVMTPAQFHDQRGIEVKTRHEVLSINPRRHTIEVMNLDSGDRFETNYTKLVIAVGSSPVLAPIPGGDLKNVFTIRTLQDGINLKKFIDQNHPRRTVIVGAGYIGLEMAEAFRMRGIEVTLIEKSDRLLGYLDPELSESIEDELKHQDVKLFRRSSVDTLSGNERGEVEAVTAITTNGYTQNHPADFVIVGVGVKPNVTLAREAGLKIGSSGSISVNRGMQTSDADIYAAGDCIEVKHLVSGRPANVPLGPAANKQGRVAGENAAGGNATFKGVVGTAIAKVFNLTVASTGLNAEEAEKIGIRTATSTISAKAIAGYYPGNKSMMIKLVMDRDSGRLVGAQIVGEAGVDKRIDVLATALYNKMTLKEISQLDLAYAPPYAPVWDPVLVAANVGLKKLRSR